MNCREIDRALADGRLAATVPGVADHLASCASCRNLVHSFGVAVPDIQPSPATLDYLTRKIAADLRPVSPIPSRQAIFACLVGIFGGVVAVGVYRMGAFALAAMSRLQAAGILGVLAICSGLLALSVVQQMSPGGRHSISPRLLPIGILAALAVLISALFRFQMEQDFWVRAWVCLRAGIPLGAMAATLFWLVLRIGTILSPATTGAASGLLSGLVGTSCLEIHCPNLGAAHIVAGHLGVALMGAGAGLAMGLIAEVVRGLEPRMRPKETSGT